MNATNPVQWYPGHMARAMRRLATDLKLIDVVIEVVDARVPKSGANPALARLVGKRPRLLVLGRSDLADPEETAAWLAHFERSGVPAVAANAKSQGDGTALRARLAALAGERRSARAIVLGIPNAGKSSIINALVRKNVARTEDRAGVTRAAQWFRVQPGLELMDTAGILVPKIDTAEAQWKLALVGAVPRARFEAEEVVACFQAWAAAALPRRSVLDLETYAQTRGFIRHGTLPDTHNAAWSYIKDFNEQKFGRITLDLAPEAAP
jgi:ribosome biogenesis GTPase A